MKPNEHEGEFRDYLHSLPPYIRESIAQSGLDFTCEEDLRSFVRNILESRDADRQHS